MKYFEKCSTIEEVKKQFHKLAKEMHPDNGGDMEAFKAMKAEYEKAFNQYKNIHKNASGETYEKDTNESPEEFADIIEKLLKFKGVMVEVCGSWLWVTGNTKEVKETLKEMGFKWSKNKGAWYFHRDPFRKFSKGTCSMEKIRWMYGSVEYRATHTNPDEAKRLEA